VRKDWHSASNRAVVSASHEDQGPPGSCPAGCIAVAGLRQCCRRSIPWASWSPSRTRSRRRTAPGGAATRRRIPNMPISKLGDTHLVIPLHRRARSLTPVVVPFRSRGSVFAPRSGNHACGRIAGIGTASEKSCDFAWSFLLKCALCPHGNPARKWGNGRSSITALLAPDPCLRDRGMTDRLYAGAAGA
jgi:hypothetical protein